MKPVRRLALLALAVTALSLWGFFVAIRPPRLAIPGSPADYRLNAEAVALVADDGVRLAGWLVPATGPLMAPAQPPAVILLHGYPAKKADLLPLGGAVALLAAAEDARIRAVSAGAPFADLRQLGRDVYGVLVEFFEGTL